MDNHIFRSSLGGFHRQDVIDYIEKSQKEAADAIAELEEKLDAVSARKQELDALLESMETESAELKDQISQLTEQCAREKTSGEVLAEELSAYKAAAAEQAAAYSRDKERVAQLELEARQRAAEVVAQAQAKADEMIAQAEERAQAIREEANKRALATLDQAEGQVAEAVRRCNELTASFSSIASHVASELHRMDVTASQLPISFNHLKGGLQEILEKAQER